MAELSIDGFVIGEVCYGTELSITDYSRMDRDTFGNLTIIQRGYSNVVKYKIEAETSRLYEIRDKLASCRAEKKTFAVAGIPGLTVTGYMKSFSIPIDSYSVTEITLEVESEVIDP